MSSTVSKNENVLVYLEENFEAHRHDHSWDRECYPRRFMEVMDDHFDGSCEVCSDYTNSKQVMRWKPPSSNWIDGPTVSRWDGKPLPEPASDFSVGPEYPTAG
jgi:hypothetical protein